MPGNISLVIYGTKAVASGYRPLVVIGDSPIDLSVPTYQSGMGGATGYYVIRNGKDRRVFSFVANPSSILTSDESRGGILRIEMSIPAGAGILEGGTPVSPYVVLEKVKEQFLFFNMVFSDVKGAYAFLEAPDDQAPFGDILGNYTLGPYEGRYVQMTGEGDSFLPIISKEEFRLLFLDPGYPEYASMRSLVVATKGTPPLGKVHLSIPREISYDVIVNGRNCGTVAHDDDRFVFPRTPSPVRRHYSMPGFEFVLGDLKIGIVPRGVEIDLDERNEAIACKVNSFPDVTRKAFHLRLGGGLASRGADPLRGGLFLHCPSDGRNKFLDENGEVDFIGEEVDLEWELRSSNMDGIFLSYDGEDPFLNSISLGDTGKDIDVFLNEGKDIPLPLFEEAARKKAEREKEAAKVAEKEVEVGEAENGEGPDGGDAEAGRQAPPVLYTVTVNGRPLGMMSRETDTLVYRKEPTPGRPHYVNQGFEIGLGKVLRGEYPEGVDVEVDEGKSIIACRVIPVPESVLMVFSLSFVGGVSHPDFDFKHYYLFCLENQVSRDLGSKGEVAFVGEELDRTWELVYETPGVYHLSVSPSGPYFSAFIPSAFIHTVTIYVSPFTVRHKPAPLPASTPINNKGSFLRKPYAVLVNDKPMGSVANGSDTFIFPQTPHEQNERLFYPRFMFTLSDVKRGVVPPGISLQMDSGRREIRCYVAPAPRRYMVRVNLIYGSSLESDPQDRRSIFLECVEAPIQKSLGEGVAVEFVGDELDKTWKLVYSGWKDYVLSFDEFDPGLKVVRMSGFEDGVNVFITKKEAELFNIDATPQKARDTLPFGVVVKVQGNEGEKSLDGLMVKISLLSKAGREFRDEVLLLREVDNDPEASHRHAVWYSTEFIPLSSNWRDDPPARIALSSEVVSFEPKPLLGQSFEPGTQNVIKLASNMYSSTSPGKEKKEKETKKGRGVITFIIVFLVVIFLVYIIVGMF